MARITQKEIKELAERKRREELPHLYGWPWYSWAWEFFTSTNRFKFLCAANQISKSSTQIREFIDWATDVERWPTLWQTKPTQFWYFYPSKAVATTEFYEKWVPEFMPRGSMKKDPVFGWDEEIKNKEVHAIHFNSGVTIYFKSYETDVQNLQSGSVYKLGADEEMPWSYFPELRSRLIATQGYFSMVFTATLGQDEWRRTIEPVTPQEELFREALKLQVSMYDCLTYKDGTPSSWNIGRIREVEQACSTEAEIQRRVYGKFVVSEGLRYPGFQRTRNVREFTDIPLGWHIYSGVDVGTGGENNHPAAIVLVAVRPDCKLGVVFRAWRGDGIVTTSSDILHKHTELLTYEIPKNDGSMIKRQYTPVLQSYDWQSRDFFLVSSAAGVTFTPANKKRDSGENLINTLFKLGMLVIADNDPELMKLVNEITSLKSDEAKTKAKDDLADAMRYAVMPIPWDFEGVAGEILKEEKQSVDTRSEAQKAFDERRPGPNATDVSGPDVEAEMLEWQGYIDSY